MGHPVPAAQTGGGRAVSTAARRPFLPRVCRLHLPVVSLPLDGKCVDLSSTLCHSVTLSEAQQGSVFALCLLRQVEQVSGVFISGLFLDVFFLLLFLLIMKHLNLLFFSLLLFISLFCSLRKKPNERPAYTELMVGTLFLHTFFPLSPKTLTNICLRYATFSFITIPAVTFSVLSLSSTRGQAHPF